MFDILFVGNSSINEIQCCDGTERAVAGGSAIGSAIAASLIRANRIAICSTIGGDYPLEALVSGLNIDVSLIGRLPDPSNRFRIAEAPENVRLVGERYLPIDIPAGISRVRHLHVSCRAGIDAVAVVEGIPHETLSFDVMFSSLRSLTREIAWLLSKAQMLFCNSLEWQMLVGVFGGTIPLRNGNTELVVLETAGSNGVIIRSSDGNFSWPAHTIPMENIVSTTGAGDAFTGGMLSAWCAGCSIPEAVCFGNAVSGLSILAPGIRHIADHKGEFSELMNGFSPPCTDVPMAAVARRSRAQDLPHLVLVVGPAAAGKSEVCRAWQDLYPMYGRLDDFAPLREAFMLGDYVWEFAHTADDVERRGILEAFRVSKTSLRYAHDIWEAYAAALAGPELELCSALRSVPVVGGGHEIVDQGLWDDVLRLAVEAIEPHRRYILEFARGNVAGRCEDVYEHPFQLIEATVPEEWMTSILALHVTAPYNQRLARNASRRATGGHFVCEETMAKVYNGDPPPGNYADVGGPCGSAMVGTHKTALFRIDNAHECHGAYRKNRIIDALWRGLAYYRSFATPGSN